MVGHGDSASDTLRVAHRPVLGESLGAFNGGGVVANGSVDIVSGTVAGDCALEGTTAAGIVRAVRLDNIILNQRVGGPAVDR